MSDGADFCTGIEDSRATTCGTAGVGALLLVLALVVDGGRVLLLTGCEEPESVDEKLVEVLAGPNAKKDRRAGVGLRAAWPGLGGSLLALLAFDARHNSSSSSLVSFRCGCSSLILQIQSGAPCQLIVFQQFIQF